MTENTKQHASTSAPRTRSPAYPAINLKEALSKANVLWGRASRHPVTVDAACTFWDFKPKSSAGYSCVAALKKYGLLTEDESATHRTVKLTDLAIGLIYNPDVDSDEYKNQLKTAALLPKIYAELWAKYEGNLPDDLVIKRFLVNDRKFNEQYVDGFIKDFRATIEFANLSASDTVSETNESAFKTNAENKRAAPSGGLKWVAGGYTLTGKVASGNTGFKGAKEVTTTEVPIFLGENKFARIPFPLTPEDYDLLVELLKSYKSRLVKSSNSPNGLEFDT